MSDVGQFAVFVGLLIVIPGVLAAIGRGILLFLSPEAYLQSKQHHHERDMASRRRNQSILGLVGRFFGL